MQVSWVLRVLLQTLTCLQSQLQPTAFSFEVGRLKP